MLYVFFYSYQPTLKQLYIFESVVSEINIYIQPNKLFKGLPILHIRKDLFLIFVTLSRINRCTDFNMICHEDTSILSEEHM